MKHNFKMNMKMGKGEHMVIKGRQNRRGREIGRGRECYEQDA